MKCAACKNTVRTSQRAFVINGSRIKAGRVCRACARFGWLLVLAEERVSRPKLKPSTRELLGLKP